MEGYTKESRRIVHGEIEQKRLEESEEHRLFREREQEANTFLGEGSFFVKQSPAISVPLLVFSGCLSAVAVFIVILLLAALAQGGLDFTSLGIGVIVITVLLFAAVFIFNIYRRGSERHYRADGREFAVSIDDSKPVDHIFYKDAESVEYKLYKFLWKPMGYHITVKMKSGFSYRYEFVFPGNGKFQRTENLPFEILRKQIEHE